MNDRFFLLPAEKQRRIINAAYKVFAENDYKKAPMSEIANAGNISKALLFHYFGSKKELYLCLWNHSIEVTRKAMKNYRVTETKDFFELIKRSLLAKCSTMQTDPYLYLFSLKAYYEQEPDVKTAIQACYQAVSDDSEDIIWNLVDLAEFRQTVDVKQLYQEILWTSDGYVRQMLSSGELNPVQVEADFMRMIEQCKNVYLK